MTFVISWSASGAILASSRGVRCCFDTAVKTLSAFSYTIFYAFSIFPSDTKSTNFLFNSASPIAASSIRLLPSCVLEGDGSSVPVRADGRWRFVAIPLRSKSIPSSSISCRALAAE